MNNQPKVQGILSLDNLTIYDVATVYFFYHNEPHLQATAFKQASDGVIIKVMPDALPTSDETAALLDRMDKTDRKEWLVTHLSNRETIDAILMMSDKAKQFRQEADSNISLLPIKPKRKKMMPDEVFTMPKPTFPHVKTYDDDKTRPLNTSDNLAELLAHYGYALKTNEMTLERELFHYGQKVSGGIEESRSLIVSLASLTGLPKSAIDDHIDALAGLETYHPVKLMLDTNGHWDGVSRVNDVINCLNAKVPNLASSVIKKWLVGCVASLYEHRFKSKLVPILHGEQSYRKTAFVERMASVIEGAFLEGAELDPDKKDSVMSCVKSWVVELGEMERTSKKGQGALKAFLTKQIDTVRPPYGRIDIKKPRQTHFIGTVNDDSFLRDETGSSRYAVLEMAEAVNMEALNRLLGWQWSEAGSYQLVDEKQLIQFWLEVKTLYQNGHGWQLAPDELALIAIANDKYSYKDSYYQAIEDRFLSHAEDDNYRKEWLTATNVCALLEVSADKSRMMGRALQRLVNEQRIEMKLTKGTKWYYLPRLDNR